MSRYAELPYRTLSPFYVHGGIPVPGLPGKTSDTVEGIWQGLKVIRGEIGASVVPRAGPKSGVVRSRRATAMARNCWAWSRPGTRSTVSPMSGSWRTGSTRALINQFVDQARQGRPQYFYDMGDNGDINDPEMPLAHASLLAQYRNRLSSKAC